MATVSNTRLSIKNIIKGVLVIVLVSLLSILCTLAYLTDATQESYVFTLGEGVDIELEQDENSITVVPGTSYSQLFAMIHLPEKTSMDYEYVGVKLHFYKEEFVDAHLQYSEISYDEFSSNYGYLQSHNCVGLGNTDSQKATDLHPGTRKDWMVLAGSGSAITGSSITGLCLLYIGENTDSMISTVASGSSVVIFDEVKVKDDYQLKYQDLGITSSGDIELYDENGVFKESRRIDTPEQYQGFKITVEAYAVQGNIDPKVAMKELTTMMIDT